MKGAGILLYCETTQRFLLGLRSFYCSEPYTWNLFGGEVEEDEDFEEGARREFLEETNIIIEGDLYLFHHHKTKQLEYKNYIAITDKEILPDLNIEHTTSRWFELDEFPNNLHYGLKIVKEKLTNK